MDIDAGLMWPIAIGLLKLVFLSAVLLFILRRIARHFGVPNNLDFHFSQNVEFGAVGHSDPGTRGCRIPQSLMKELNIERSVVNGRVAEISFLTTGEIDKEILQDNFVIVVPERDRTGNIRVDADTWRDIKKMMQPGRGRPQLAYFLQLRVDAGQVNTVRYLLNDHPVREARITAWVTLMTSSFSMIALLLFEVF